MNFSSFVRKHGIALHAIAFLIGAANYINSGIRIFAEKVRTAAPSDIIPNPHLREFFWHPEKPDAIIAYCATVIAVAIAGIWISVLWKRYRHDLACTKSTMDAVAIGLALALSLAPYVSVPLVGLAFSAGAWFIACHWPMRTILKSWMAVKPANLLTTTPPTRTLAIILILAFGQIFLMYGDFIFGRIFIPNEFLSIPEKTLLPSSDHNTPSQEVDNFSFIKEHRLAAPWTLDRRDKDQSSDLDPFSIPTLRTAALDLLIRSNPALAYDDDKQRLLILAPLDDTTWRRLFDTLPDQTTRQSFLSACSNIEYYKTDVEERVVRSPDESTFLDANCGFFRGLHVSAMNRGFVHHHGFIINPTNEWLSGRPVQQIHFQYGFLSSYLTGRICQLLWSDFTYQGFIKVYFSLYVIYFIAFSALCWYLWGAAGVIPIAAITIAWASTGYHFTLLAPGLNPIRHFIDLPVLLLVWQWQKSRNTALGSWWMFSALVLAACGAFLNREFSIFLTAAIFATAIAQYALTSEKHLRWHLVAGLICGCAIAFTLLLTTKIGRTGVEHYYLLGLLGFPMNKVAYLGLTFIGTTCAALILIRILSEKATHRTWFALFCLFYAAEALTYLVWHGALLHIWFLAPIWIFAIYAILSDWGMDRRLITHASSLRTTILLLGLANAIAIGGYLWGRHQHWRQATTHHTYAWDFPRFQCLTTMDPQPFQESVDLIHRHETAPGIFILSKYDMILPFLANRYSAMPYFDLSNFLITAKEVQEATALIQTQKPALLFIDHDIEQTLRTDIIPPFGPFGPYCHQESWWRVQRLELLQDIFNSVKKDYIKVDEGGVLAVWKRINHTQ